MGKPLATFSSGMHPRALGHSGQLGGLTHRPLVIVRTMNNPDGTSHTYKVARRGAETPGSWPLVPLFLPLGLAVVGLPHPDSIFPSGWRSLVVEAPYRGPSDPPPPLEPPPTLPPPLKQHPPPLGDRHLTTISPPPLPGDRHAQGGGVQRGSVSALGIFFDPCPTRDLLGGALRGRT